MVHGHQSSMAAFPFACEVPSPLLPVASLVLMQEAGCRYTRVTMPPSLDTPARAGTRQQLEVPRSIVVPRSRVMPVAGAAAATGGLALLPMAGKTRLEKSWAHSWQVCGASRAAEPCASCTARTLLSRRVRASLCDQSPWRALAAHLQVTADIARPPPSLMGSGSSEDMTAARNAAAAALGAPPQYGIPATAGATSARTAVAPGAAPAAGQLVTPFSIPVAAIVPPGVTTQDGTLFIPPGTLLMQPNGTPNPLYFPPSSMSGFAPPPLAVGPTTASGYEDRIKGVGAAPAPRLSRLSQSAPQQHVGAGGPQQQQGQPWAHCQACLSDPDSGDAGQELPAAAVGGVAYAASVPVALGGMVGAATLEEGDGRDITAWLPELQQRVSEIVALEDGTLEGTALDAALLTLSELEADGGGAGRFDACASGDGDDGGIDEPGSDGAGTPDVSTRSSSSSNSSSSGGTGDASGGGKRSIGSAALARRGGRLVQSTYALGNGSAGVRRNADAPWLNSISCPAMHSRLQPGRKHAAAVAAAQQLLSVASAQAAPTPTPSPADSMQLFTAEATRLTQSALAAAAASFPDEGYFDEKCDSRNAKLAGAAVVASPDASPLTYTFSSIATSSSGRGSTDTAFNIVTGPGGMPMLVGAGTAGQTGRSASMPSPMPVAVAAGPAGGAADQSTSECRVYRAYSSDLYRSTAPAALLYSSAANGAGSYRQAYQQQQWNWVAAAAGAAMPDCRPGTLARSSTGSIPVGATTAYMATHGASAQFAGFNGGYGVTPGVAVAGGGGQCNRSSIVNGLTPSPPYLDCMSGRSTPTHQPTPCVLSHLPSPLVGSPSGSHSSLHGFGANHGSDSAAVSVCGSEASFCSDPPVDESIIFSWISTRRRVQGMDPLDAWAEQRSGLGLGGLSMAVTLGAAPSPTPLVQRYGSTAASVMSGSGAMASGAAAGASYYSGGHLSSAPLQGAGGFGFDPCASPYNAGSLLGSTPVAVQGYGGDGLAASAAQQAMMCAPGSPQSGDASNATAAGWWQALAGSLDTALDASHPQLQALRAAFACGGDGAGAGPGHAGSCSPPNDLQGSSGLAAGAAQAVTGGTARVAAAAAAALDSLHALREKQRRQRRYAATRTAFAGVLEEEEEELDDEMETVETVEPVDVVEVVV